MKQDVDFKMSDGKCILEIVQELDDEEFVGRVVNIGKQLYNMNNSIKENSKQVLDLGKQSEQTKEMIVNVEKDLEKAKNFLKKNHKENLIIKIDEQVKKYVEDLEKAAEEQKKLQESQMENRI